jgi:putative colanic acid biosynthesis UDP-glucose lipid carrier transferase
MARGLLKHHSQLVGFVQKMLDVAVIAGTLYLAKAFYRQPLTDTKEMVAAFAAVALFIFFSDITRLYRSWRAHTLWEEFEALAYTLVGTILGLLLLASATKTTEQFSRLAIGTWWLLLPVILILVRSVVRSTLKHFRQQGYNRRNVAILGTGTMAQQLAREILANDWMGLKITGFYDDRRDFREKLDEGVPTIPITGIFDDLIREAKSNHFDEIYIALPMKAEQLINRLVNELADSSISVHIVPDLLTFKLLNARTSNLGQIPIVSVYEAPMDEIEMIVKRTLDIVLSLVILAVIAFPMLLIAIAIKLTSRGPVIFRQHRYGLRGEQIEVWKFRSMTVTENGVTINQASRNDARITPLGTFLRKTSMDELPQFFNVLQGTMSIVGPRPHAVAHNELYRKSIDGYMLRHLVKPGITGWAQVNGWRGETDTDEKMQKRIEYDLEYLRNWSLFLDLKIILMTIWRGFVNKNAY